jgi:hypothetical protein
MVNHTRYAHHYTEVIITWLIILAMNTIRTHSLQSEKKFSKSHYIVNTIISRQGHIIQLIDISHILKKCKTKV